MGEVCPCVDVVVVAYGEEPLLKECIESIAHSEGVFVRIALVDNGCSNSYLHELASLSYVHLVSAGANIGFPAGVRLGANQGVSEFVAIINSDVVLEPTTLASLVAVAQSPGVGICMPQILRRTDGLLNSAGNPLHVLGFSWAGGNGSEPLNRSLPVKLDVAVASGAFMLLRRETWNRLGGMPDEFFLYQEDVDLSIACHQAGLAIALVPSACVSHDYSWSRNAEKTQLAERNRILVILTRYPRALLFRTLPPLLLAEFAVLLLGGLPGVRSAKLRGYAWIFQNRRWVRDRRRQNIGNGAYPNRVQNFLTDAFGDDVPVRTRGMGLVDQFLPRYLRLVGLRIQQSSESAAPVG